LSHAVGTIGLAGSNMSTGEAMDDAPNACRAGRMSSTREALMLAMLVYGLAQSLEAFGADQSVNVVKDIQPMVGGKPLPKAFAPALPANELETPTTAFRRRRLDALDSTSSAQLEPFFQSKPLQETSPWQRLGDYRAQGRVQLLTLWQSPRNMVSLQTGRHGGPSLQWSSRGMNRGGATRGVLDRLVASSLGSTGLRAKIAAHSTDSGLATKATSPLAAIGAP
jgi:hypothetical protein